MADAVTTSWTTATRYSVSEYLSDTWVPDPSDSTGSITTMTTYATVYSTVTSWPVTMLFVDLAGISSITTPPGTPLPVGGTSGTQTPEPPTPVDSFSGSVMATSIFFDPSLTTTTTTTPTALESTTHTSSMSLSVLTSVPTLITSADAPSPVHLSSASKIGISVSLAGMAIIMLMGLGAHLWKRRSRLKYLCRRRSKTGKLVRARGNYGPRGDALDGVGARREALEELEEAEMGDGSEKYGVSPDDEIQRALWETRRGRPARHERVSEFDGRNPTDTTILDDHDLIQREGDDSASNPSIIPGTNRRRLEQRSYEMMGGTPGWYGVKTGTSQGSSEW